MRVATSQNRGWASALLLLLAAFLVAACDAEGSAENPAVEATGTTAAAASDGRPDIVFVMTDDQEQSTLPYMAHLKNEVGAKGAVLEDHHLTEPLCCPTRATVLTGMYAHNTGIVDNAPGFPEFRNRGLEQKSVNVALRDAGYWTSHVGKVMNYYEENPSYVPPGWDDWHAWATNSSVSDYNSYKMNDDGVVSSQTKYNTDLYQDRARAAIREAPDDRPMYLQVWTNAPHSPFQPAERHKGMFASAKIPRTPDFTGGTTADSTWRKKLQMLQSVDELLKGVDAELAAEGKLENTYVFYVSDNGFRIGYRNLPNGKRYWYYTDVQFPMYVRGPGIAAGTKIGALTGSNDLAPTFADIAGTTLPDADGRSLLPLLADPRTPWRKYLGLEHPTDAQSPYRWTGVVTDTHKYVKRNAGNRLYDRAADPHEVKPITNATLGNELLRKTDELHACEGEACRLAEGP